MEKEKMESCNQFFIFNEIWVNQFYSNLASYRDKIENAIKTDFNADG